MRIAQSPNDLLFNLSEIRPKHAVKRFRKAIIEDYPGERCAYCDRKATSWTLDHVIPKSKAAPPGGGIWFDAALNATAEKVITIFCLGIAPNIFGINTEKILYSSG